MYSMEVFTIIDQSRSLSNLYSSMSFLKSLCCNNKNKYLSSSNFLGFAMHWNYSLLVFSICGKGWRTRDTTGWQYTSLSCLRFLSWHICFGCTVSHTLKSRWEPWSAAVGRPSQDWSWRAEPVCCSGTCHSASSHTPTVRHRGINYWLAL